MKIGVYFRQWRSRHRTSFVWRIVLVLLLGAVGVFAAQGPATAAPATITLGVASYDQNGNQLQLHGLGIIKVGGTYYGFGEDKTGESSANTSFIAIPCYSSTNLATWTYQSEALSRQSSGDLGPNRIVERPKVIYNSSTGQYVMYLHIDNSSYSEAKVGVATSSSVCGPYTYRGSFQPLGFQSRDIGLFQDTNGQAYLLSEDRAHGLRIDALSSDYLSVTSAVAVLPDYEAPAMVKVAGRYFLFGSHLSGWASNDNQYATATSLAGPWSGWQDFAPAGTNTYNSQTANVITVQGSAGTTYIYAGDRWNTADLGASTLIWLPLTISGTTASITWYSSWSIDTATGTWSPGSSSGSKTLVGKESGRCLDVADQSTTRGAAVDIWDCNGAGNQAWNINGDGTITSVQSGLCLDVKGQSTTRGTVVDMWTCNGQANQRWTVNSNGKIVGVQSGLCLDVLNNATANGTGVDIWTCNGGSNQAWTAQ
ncbi:MAG TPA: RICIN domain-containing protein [Actinocrinis sp.]|jgi:hypothetical protein|uniref:RICIN domain-containing protein n=1 Tax=Actinocrinis sp. TaxID=1920516 RepID=UPI002DDD61A1|nr:RICIN domain-containing protein [Actinocrinis sp.]HEV3172945.1 RICIN domain-containing protein [Actinocrinis sp.]